MDKEFIKSTINKNRGILSNYGVKSFAIFGSFVRGRQSKRSDIDFLVEFKKATFRNYMGLLHSLEDMFGRNIDLVTKKSLGRRVRPYILKEAEYIEGR